MRVENESLNFVISALCVPFLFLISPQWLTLQGVSPCWAVLWLLPWSLNKGKAFGFFSGLCLGLFLDGLSGGIPTQIPVLMALGIWWGHIGSQGKSITLIFNLGLLALIGSIIFGFSIWTQNLFAGNFLFSSWFNYWSFHTLISQSVLTGLIAPITCSWILLKSYRQR
tara:strand:+ start:4124 stop:4627 length:504 start_codon:yes stop_codon:yes gene_type:complete